MTRKELLQVKEEITPLVNSALKGDNAYENSAGSASKASILVQIDQKILNRIFNKVKLS